MNNENISENREKSKFKSNSTHEFLGLIVLDQKNYLNTYKTVEMLRDADIKVVLTDEECTLDQALHRAHKTGLVDPKNNMVVKLRATTNSEFGPLIDSVLSLMNGYPIDLALIDQQTTKLGFKNLVN